MSSVFWPENICVLVSEPDLIPLPSMSKTERLNALTRLVLIGALILFVMKFKKWYVFLLAALLVILLAGYGSLGCLKKLVPEKKEPIVENFTITPTATDANFQRTTVAPTFAEEWQIPPPAYDMRINRGNASNASQFCEYMRPQSYPYGQYLTRTNLLPSDEYYIHQGNGSVERAREYQNSYILRNDLAFRDNMTRLIKMRMARQNKQSANFDSFSPYMSY